MTDKQLTEAFIKERLGDEGVAEYKEFMKKGREAERAKKRADAIANRNPHILELEADLSYRHGGDGMFEEGNRYCTTATLKDYVRHAIGLDMSEHWSRGEQFFKLESTCEYLNKWRSNRGWWETKLTPDQVVDTILKVIKNGSDEGTKWSCGQFTEHQEFHGFKDIDRGLYTDDELRTYFKNCYYYVDDVSYFVPD